MNSFVINFLHNFLHTPKRQKLTCVICLEIDMKNMGLLPPSPSKCRDFYLLNFNVQLFSTLIFMPTDYISLIFDIQKSRFCIDKYFTERESMDCLSSEKF